MRTLLILTLFVFGLIPNIDCQTLVSATQKGSRSKQQISSLFNLPIIKYGATYYRITYTSKDAKGSLDTLSGLLVVPDNLKFEYAKLVYQHGTSACKQCVPSNYGINGGDEGELGLLFAGLGFIAILPDYVGMGDGRGFQTYVHNETIVSATTDMIAAAEEWANKNAVFYNDQLFITGYSQGGYASMALHKHLESISDGVTAAAHLSGPYSLSGVMRDLIFSEKEYFYPSYIPNTILGFQEVYGNIYTELSDFFKPEYVTDIEKYYNGNISLLTLNTRLIAALKNNTGASVGARIIRDDVKNAIQSDPNHVVNKILRENDVYDWSPKAPTKIFYCKADDQVPYENSLVAKDVMTSNGASNLEVRDVNPTADHGACFSPALTSTVLFFLGLQRITSDVETSSVSSLKVYPNPANDHFYIEGLEEDHNISLFNMAGEKVYERINESSHHFIDVSCLHKGMYHLKIGVNGKVLAHRKIAVLY